MTDTTEQLAVFYTKARKLASSTTDGALQVGYAAQAHAALREFAKMHNCNTDEAAAKIREMVRDLKI